MSLRFAVLFFFLISCFLYAGTEGPQEISVTIYPAPSKCPVMLPEELPRGINETESDPAVSVSAPKFIQADLVIEIKNISSRKFYFYEEWNSWGYSNLKFVFGGYMNDFWVTKQPGNWYRNFPSAHLLAPGESFKIPVAFNSRIWTGLDQIEKYAKEIMSIRALYEQYSDTKLLTLGKYNDFKPWKGSVSSEVYLASELLSRFKFRKPPEKNNASEEDLGLKIE